MHPAIHTIPQKTIAPGFYSKIFHNCSAPPHPGLPSLCAAICSPAQAGSRPGDLPGRRLKAGGWKGKALGISRTVFLVLEALSRDEFFVLFCSGIYSGALFFGIIIDQQEFSGIRSLDLRFALP
jgi:hypothetical protein